MNWKRWSHLDPRSLAIMRICTGLLILMDLAGRFRCLKDHYTDQGILPCSMARALSESGPWTFCVHTLSGTIQFQMFLFGLAALAAVALLVGWRTQWVTLLSWFLLLSLHHRNRFLNDGGDYELRMLLFWAIFLPWGARWSVDSRSTRSYPVAPLAATAYMLQIASIYLVTGLHKLTPFWLDGSAIFRSLSLINFQGPLGAFAASLFSDHPSLGRLATWSVLAWELTLPLLLLSPFCRERTRLVAVATGVAFHLMVAATMDVNIFQWVSIVALLGFLPWPKSSEPEPLTTRGTRAQSAAIISVLVTTLWFSLSQFLPIPQPRFGGLVPGLGLNNPWSMFAEGPDRDVWFVAVGIQVDGRQVDLFQYKAVVFSRPSFPGYMEGRRWTPCLLRLYSQNWAQDALPSFAEWLGRRYREKCPDGIPLERIELTHVSKPLGIAGAIEERELVFKYQMPLK